MAIPREVLVRPDAADIRRTQPNPRERRLNDVEELQYRVESYVATTVAGAVGAFIYVADRHLIHTLQYGERPTQKNVIDAIKPGADGAATNPMLRVLNRVKLVSRHLYSEGKKEAQKDHGGVAAPRLEGTSNEGMNYPVTDNASDALEKTTEFASQNPLGGATSVFASTTENGLLPQDEKDSHLYWMKLAGPPPLKGAISLDNTAEENFDRALGILGLRGNPKDLTVVMLNPKSRLVNQPGYDAAKKLGLTIDIPDSGDFMPGMYAMQPLEDTGRAVLALGRGGIDEGAAAAIGAVGSDGVFEAQFYHQDFSPEANAEMYPVLGRDTIVPGERGLSLVSMSQLSEDDRWFKTHGIQKVGRDYLVATRVFTHKGMTTYIHLADARGDIIETVNVY